MARDWIVSKPCETAINGAVKFRLTCRRCGLKGAIWYLFEPKTRKRPSLLPICRVCHPE